MKTISLFLTLTILTVSASLAQAGDEAKKMTNENGVAFMDYKCSKLESAKQLIFADSDVEFMASGMMLNSKERVLSVKLTARSGIKQSSDLLLFLKRISKADGKINYSFDTKLGAVLAIEEISSENGRSQTMKIQLIEESGTSETTITCATALGGN